MRKSAPAKKTLKPKTALGIVQGKIVRQSTLDQIRKDGMAKAIAKVKSGKATPEYKAGATRMYGVKRTVSGGKAQNLKKPVKGKGFEGIATRGMLNAMTATERAVKNVAKGYIAYTKAVTVDAPKNIKKVIALRNKKAPQLRKKAK